MTEILTGHLLALLGTLVLLLAASGAGRRLVGGWSSDSTLLAMAAPMVGFGLLAMWSFAILAVGGLPPLLHLVLPAVGLMVAVHDLPQLRLLWRAVRDELAAAWPVVGAALVIALAVILPLALGPVVDWDSLSFHSRVPEQLIQARRLMVPDDNLHVAQLGISHLAFASARVAGVPAAVALLSLVSAIGVILATAVLVMRLAGATAARIAAIGMAGTPLLLIVSMTPRVDAFLAVALMIALLAVTSDWKDGTPERAAVAVALLGVAAGTKFHGIAYAALMLPCIAWLLRGGIAPRVGAAFGLALILVVPWLAVNQLHFGSPVYPFLAAPRVEPWLAAAVGTEGLPAAFDTRFLDALSDARQPFDLMAFLFNPAAISIEVEGTWYRPSLLLLLLPLGLLVKPRGVLIPLLVPAACYIALTLGLNETTNLRYFLPAVGPLTVIAAVGTAAALDRLRVTQSSMLMGFLLLLAAWPTLMMAMSILTPAVLGHAVGRSDANEFRLGHPDQTVRIFADVPGSVRDAVGASGRALLLFEARGGAFDVPVIADTRSSNWPLLAQTSLASTCLAGTGITHVLMNTAALGYYVRRGADAAALRLPELSKFAATCLTPLWDHNGFALFRLSHAAGDREPEPGASP